MFGKYMITMIASNDYLGYFVEYRGLFHPVQLASTDLA